MSNLLIVQAIVYGFAFWFGLYLLARSDGKPGLAFAGFGLVAYALGVAVASVSRYEPSLAAALSVRYPLLTLLPAGFWFGAAYSLLPEANRPSIPTRRLVAPLPFAVIGIALILAGDLARPVLTVAPLAIVLAALGWVWRAFRWSLPRPPLKVLFTATLFFALGYGLIVLPLEIVSNEIVLLAIGGDLLMLGYAISKLDAYDEGTTLLPDALRSLAGASLAAIAVSGQVFLFIVATGPPSLPLVVLFYTTLSIVITLATWQSRFQKLLDRLLFGNKTRVTQERETLISVSDALPRQDTTIDPMTLDEAEFARLTRRALSHYNDLGKLASSPLTRLPIITERLRTQGKLDTSLERAHELRHLLKEQILRLKPRHDVDFESGDEWRYFNALYFPYVLGLKPYNVRSSALSLDPTLQQALGWFQTYVPERTLYNWQTNAAKLIARQLREAVE